MWPEPDQETAWRMRTARTYAQSAMSLCDSTSDQETWGWRGRTLSQPVSTAEGPAWLRVASTPAGQAAATFWDGQIEAEKAMPASIPRPRLRSWHDWLDGQWQYRAELYDRAQAIPVSTSAVLTMEPDLPPAWWAATRSALNDIGAVPTRRLTIQPAYLRQAMPRFLGTPASTSSSPGSWITAHGDFHFANISAPSLQIFDFEGWGLAPHGYDVATLHSYSLLVPAVAARIREEFANVLNTPSGRFAELVAITELIHATSRGEHLQLLYPLRQRAALLLGRSVPPPGPQR